MTVTISEPLATLLVGLVLVAVSRTMRALNGRTNATARAGSTR